MDYQHRPFQFRQIVAPEFRKQAGDGFATGPDELRDLLSRQLTSPVQFSAATLALPESVTTTVELPPSGVLTGLTKRIRTFERQYAPASLVELEGVEL